MYTHTIDFLLKTSIKTAFTKKPVNSIKTSSRFHYPYTEKNIREWFFKISLPLECDVLYIKPLPAFLSLKPIEGYCRSLKMDLTYKEVQVPPSVSNLNTWKRGQKDSRTL